MKKIFTILFVTGLFSLAACGPNEEEKAKMDAEEKAKMDSAFNAENRDSLFDAAAATMQPDSLAPDSAR